MKVPREPLRFAPAAFVLVLAIALGAWALAHAADPFDQPGETWMRGSPMKTFDIHLLPDGRYAGRESCAVCDPETHYGRWSETGGVIELRPEHRPGDHLRLKRARVDGCDALVALPFADGKAQPANATFFRKASDCERRSRASSEFSLAP